MVYHEFEESVRTANGDGGRPDNYGDSFNYGSYMKDNWVQNIETTMPLKQSKLASLKFGANNNNHGDDYHGRDNNNNNNRLGGSSFQASVEFRSRAISKKLIIVNLISLLINLLLAIVGFYFSFVNNSSTTTAFAADCVLDFISSAIVLWRYYGDLNSMYMQAREQIACIYLGALFEISALAIIIKASTDMAVGPDANLEQTIGYDLVYLAAAATVTCTIVTVFKCSLYRTIRDESILLDVINTVISTVFAMSIIMSQALININPSFWYVDPILSIILALFMAGFGLKVIHQNFNILRPVYCSASPSTTLLNKFNPNDKSSTRQTFMTSINRAYSGEEINNNNNNGQPSAEPNFGSNLNTSLELGRSNWQKTNYNSISFM